MNTVQKLCSVALSAALLCGHAAASTVEASISNIQWALIDLKPNDGVVPTLNLHSDSDFSGVYVNQYLPYEGWQASSQDFLAPLSAGKLVGVSHGFATVSPTGITAEASTDGQAGWSILARSNVGIPGWSGLTLAPYSALHMTATAWLDMSRTLGDSIYASYEVTYYSDRGEGRLSQTLRTPYGDLSDMPMSQNSPIDVYITNYSARAIPISFGLQVNIGADAAVPEPGTVGLLLGGLMVLVMPRLRRIATN